MAAEEAITKDSLPFEFMLNALRLTDGVAQSLFTERTGLELELLEPQLSQLRQAGLMRADGDRLQTTALGARFLNDVVGKFSD